MNLIFKHYLHSEFCILGYNSVQSLESPPKRSLSPDYTALYPAEDRALHNSRCESLKSNFRLQRVNKRP
jgi:hypothetical protein